ncbi:MAG: hypothetical protein HS119_04830 [Flavobacteriales bacterium]|nr:hypothetical protein [Flavobacteriales bacterium]
MDLDKKSIKKIGAVLLVFILLLLTLLRENVFLEINGVLNQTGYNKAYFYLLDPLISNLSIAQLVLLKWILTIGFILLISSLTVLVVKWWFNQTNYTSTTIKIILLLFIVSSVITFILWLLGLFNHYYVVLRKMVGFLSSPLPLFLFFVMYLYLNLVRDND